MIRLVKIIPLAGLGGLALGLLTLPAPAAQPVAVPANLPLYFEASQGQANAPAQFVARGHDYQFLISPAEAQIVLRKTTAESAVVRMQFVGANAQAPVRGDAELPGKINHLTGNDPAQWRVGLAMFAKVRVGGLYPGVNLVYYGNQQQLEYDFDIAPGANPLAIAMHFDGVDKISINPQGELILSLAGGEIRQPKPVIYQVIGGARKEIEGGYRLVDAHTVAFTIGQYDHSQPLVIDPLLSYSTYIGGDAGDTAWSVTLDINGNVYIAGQTFSKQFANNVPFTTNAYQANFAGGKLTGDAFVFKLDAASGYPAYITYLGGSDDEVATCLAVDNNGNAFVAGYTDSTNFPVSTNAIQKKIGGAFRPSYGSYPVDAFVTELGSAGTNIIYSTYFGGAGVDSAYGIAVDAADNAYITGFTSSTNFPVMNAIAYRLAGRTNTVLDHLACTNSFYFNANAFIAIIGPGGTNLVCSSYFGGTNFDEGKGIAVDTNGFVYVTGFTASTNFPTTNAVYQQMVWTNIEVTPSSTNYVSITNTWNGSLLNGSITNTSPYDAFVAKFASTGTNLNLIYSTFLGGTNNDVANGIAVDNNGAAYVTGWTISTNFPNTVTNIAALHSFVATNTSFSVLATNVFLTKIITNGTQAVIAWSTIFGGNGADIGYGVAVDPAGEAFVTGAASSTNFPTFNVPTLMRYTNSGKSDAFVIAFNTNATALLYSTYLGGKDNDYGYGIAVYTNGDAYVVGQTLSTNFLTLIADYPTLNGTNDAFLTKIMLSVTAPTNATILPTNQAVAVGSNATFSVSVDTNGTPPFFYQWQDGTNLVNGTNLVDAINISGATTTSLTITNAQMTNSGFYYQVIVTNYGGSVTSIIAGLTVTNVPPAITVQPTNQLVGAGTGAILTVTATGTAPLSYQWQIQDTNSVSGWTNLVNGGRISGATTNVLTISNVQTNDNNTGYSVIVTNYGGSVTSALAVLTVTALPKITLQPTNESMAVGATAAFTVTAIGTVPLHFQWQIGTNNPVNLVNRGNINGTTANTLTITNAQTTNSGEYTVVVTNIAGVVTSSVAVLNVTNIPPTITLQPASQTNGVGTKVTMTVTATGTSPLSYQWIIGGTTNLMSGTNLVNGVKVITSGATSNVLTISNVQTNNDGNYTVVVTGPGGSTNSSVAVLTVYSSPVITVQPTPTNQAIAVGATATYSVTAIGTVPLSYQWLVNGTSLTNGGGISGAKTNVLTITTTNTPNITNSYSVIVTNVAGSVTSSNVLLTVTNKLPTITVQPTNQTVATATTVNFAVTATGTLPLSYQWQLNGTNLVNSGHSGQISGATTWELTIKNAQTTNSGNYTVVITNFAGSVTSSVATLTVAASPLITMQPTNQTIVAGSTATFAVTVIGTVPLHYQWQMNGTNLVNGGGISNVTTTVLTIGNAQTNNSGSYSVIVSNSVGSVTSSNAVLTMVSAPVIVMQPTPTNQAIAVGSDATFTVAAIGIAPLSYQWQMNGTNLVDGTNLVNGDITSGSTTTNLTISNAQTNNSGTYTVVITNIAGSVASSNAVLTVVRLMVVAWGNNDHGQTNVPVDATNVMAIAGGGYHSLALQTNGTVVAWGANDFGEANVPADLTNVVAIAAGYVHSLALQANGTVVAWGAGTNNTGSFPAYGQAIVPADLTNVVAIAAGFFHNLALQANGTVVAWGAGQTNNPSDGYDYGQSIVPVGLSNVVAVAGSGYDSLALQVNGTVVVWGDNTYGQTNMPADLTNVVAIAGGGFHSLALRANGTVVVWGDNTYGQTDMPADLTNVVAIAGGGYHSLALQANGTVVAWEADDDGQTNVPADLTNVVAVAGGYLHSMALENDGSPFIVRQPASQTASTNITVTFTVIALGAPALSYEWQKNGSNLIDGGNVSGSTSTTLTLTDVQDADAAGYAVVITNAIGSVTSSNAVLTVTNIPLGFIPPSFGNIIAESGVSGSFILSGTGGLSNGTYYVLASSNLLAPLTNWTYIATNQFDSEGNFIFTNTAQTNAPQEFYLLQLP
ncbi:MAG: immunoglobulin domain-containing protein [Verrucomicrobiota bacterium]